MALPFSEAFTGTGALSGSWTAILNAPVRDTGRGTGGAGVAENTARVNSETFSDNQKCSCLVGTPTTIQNIGLILQADGTHQYAVVCDDLHTTMYRLVNTTYTQLQQNGPVSVGDTIEFRVASDTISVWVNSSQQGTDQAGGGSYTGGTPGIWFFSTGTFMDNFSADNNGSAAIVRRLSLLGVG